MSKYVCALVAELERPDEGNNRLCRLAGWLAVGLAGQAAKATTPTSSRAARPVVAEVQPERERKSLFESVWLTIRAILTSTRTTFSERRHE